MSVRTLLREATIPPGGLLQIYRVHLTPGERDGVPNDLPNGLYIGARLHGPLAGLNALFGPLTEDEATEVLETMTPLDWIKRLMGALRESQELDDTVPDRAVRH